MKGDIMKGDIIYLTLYLLTEMLNYLLVYKVIFGAEITRNRKRVVLGIGAVFIIHFVLLAWVGKVNSETCSIFTMVLLPLLLLENREKKYFMIYPFIVIGTANLIVSFTFLFGVFFDVSGHYISEDYWFGLLCQCMPIFMMLILAGYRVYRRKKPIQVQLGRQQYILFYIGVFCSFLLMMSIELFSMGEISEEIINSCGLSSSIASIVFIILILWQGIVVHREIQYKEQCEMNEKYMEAQEEHFRQLMEQDEKMRKFRHDMNSHIHMMKYFCENDKQQELKEYLARLTEESTVEEVRSYTGNQSVDAILSPLIHRAKEKQIALKIKGELSEETKVSAYDLCTILSNLLRNAIEACEKVPPKKQRNIEVILGSYNRQLYFQVGNTVADTPVIGNHRLETSKEDKRNHGIGSRNVKETVEKYEGEIIYGCENGWFQVEISI